MMRAASDGELLQSTGRRLSPVSVVDYVKFQFVMDIAVPQVTWSEAELQPN